MLQVLIMREYAVDHRRVYLADVHSCPDAFAEFVRFLTEHPRED
jgi:hypothetical protein